MQDRGCLHKQKSLPTTVRGPKLLLSQAELCAERGNMLHHLPQGTNKISLVNPSVVLQHVIPQPQKVFDLTYSHVLQLKCGDLPFAAVLLSRCRHSRHCFAELSSSGLNHRCYVKRSTSNDRAPFKESRLAWDAAMFQTAIKLELRGIAYNVPYFYIQGDTYTGFYIYTRHRLLRSRTAGFCDVMLLLKFTRL
jgi:hypothetical protein